jgi:hypothetical protein
MADIEAVLEQHTAALLQIPGVLGVGLGVTDSMTSVVVLVSKLTPELEYLVLEMTAPAPVQLQAVGGIQAANDS